MIDILATVGIMLIGSPFLYLWLTNKAMDVISDKMG